MDPFVPLVTPAEIQAVMGGVLLPAEKVTAAGEEVRVLAGWHIAPKITETLILDHNGGGRLLLPSLKVGEVTSIQSLAGSDPVELTGWRWSADGWIQGCFPCGPRVLSVTLTHGYAAIPPALIRMTSDRTRRRIIQEGIGARSATFSEEADRGVESILDRYSLAARP